ncbi:response regulator [Erythrobacter longus]|uniref:response regulator n=1 Tax=Erythrobacter longus TaxID=1044 RepID=UPI000551B019|nr:response regulator [Erythrobacter longus]
MSLSQQLAGDLPFLRRYARALSGSQETGDAMVRSALELALKDEALRRSLEGGRTALYTVFHSTLDNNEPANAEVAGSAPDARTSTNYQEANQKEASAMRKLAAITDQKRQALLLTTVEEFTPQQAAQILGVEVSDVETLVSDAVAQIDAEQKTRVLIIEDEPMILMQLEDLAMSLDHEVCGTARTHAEAVAAVKAEKPGLVLADIQLADGSSGLEAVKEILAISNVPVIFITAYPERLLTGDRLEPAYLVTKPFREQTVKAAISQALFFG